MATSQDFATWTCGPRIVPKFLLYSLRAQPQEIERRKMGSTHQTIYMPDIKSLETPLPPVRVQNVIVDYLDRETARIDAVAAAKTKMLGLLHQKWLAALESVIWSGAAATTPLMRVVDPARQVMYGIVLPGPDVGPDGVAIVKGGDVAQGRLSWDLLCKTTPEIEAPFARARLRGGDLVFAIRGSIGDVALVPDSIAGANITQDVARVAPGRDIDSKWLMYALQSPTAQSDARRRVTGATITGLNIWELARVRVPMIEIAQQHEQRSVLDGLRDRTIRTRWSIERQLDLLAERRQAVINAAVVGQLEVAEAA
jgi:type I restriction enzyme S subunit